MWSMVRCFSALQRAENSSTETRRSLTRRASRRFQCSSASRKFLNLASKPLLIDTLARFSALQRAENSSTRMRIAVLLSLTEVSVLFSEPKIPQPKTSACPADMSQGFSALQRAENSSTPARADNVSFYIEFQCSSASRKFLNPNGGFVLVFECEEFQCSSASRKFLNHDEFHRSLLKQRSFSALQRAENSSTVAQGWQDVSCREFQCSSASRKFLNPPEGCHDDGVIARFSALQRAENSSTVMMPRRVLEEIVVSVLFSEPKIPQPARGA